MQKGILLFLLPSPTAQLAWNSDRPLQRELHRGIAPCTHADTQSCHSVEHMAERKSDTHSDDTDVEYCDGIWRVNDMVASISVDASASCVHRPLQCWCDHIDISPCSVVGMDSIGPGDTAKCICACCRTTFCRKPCRRVDNPYRNTEAYFMVKLILLKVNFINY